MPALFALFNTVFGEQQKRIVEDFCGGLKSHAVLLAIAAALVGVPLIPHCYTYRITAILANAKGIGVAGTKWARERSLRQDGKFEKRIQARRR